MSGLPAIQHPCDKNSPPMLNPHPDGSGWISTYSEWFPKKGWGDLARSSKGSAARRHHARECLRADWRYRNRQHKWWTKRKNLMYWKGVFSRPIQHHYSCRFIDESGGSCETYTLS